MARADRPLGLSAFVNRSPELEALETWFSRPGPGLGIVYGRRRVGKTWLLAKFSEGRRVVSHTARGRSFADELHLISAAAHHAGIGRHSTRTLLERPIDDLDELFDALAEAAREAPLLLVLDEFPELLAAAPNLEEELRSVWDRLRIHDSNLKVLLCGSHERVMESLQSHDHAMFGRADLLLRVLPFTPHEAAQMLREAPPEERAAAWGVCGGSPRYLSLWDERGTFRENLEVLICNERGLLLAEGELVLADEDLVGHRGKRMPERVLRAIASGKTTYRAIEAATGTLPTRALQEMTQGRLIERVRPVTARRDSKLTSYRIADNFLAFWLRCVEPHQAAIEQGLGPTIAPVIEASFDDFMGPTYEAAFRAHLRRLAADGQFGPEVVDVGEWWSTQVQASEDPCQLDAVVLAGRQRQPVAVGEVKWARKVNGSSQLGAMRRKLLEGKLVDPDLVTYVVGARSEVVRAEGVLAVTAADIFE